MNNIDLHGIPEQLNKLAEEMRKLRNQVAAPVLLTDTRNSNEVADHTHDFPEFDFDDSLFDFPWQWMIDDRAVNTPTGSETGGERYIVGSAPSGDFSTFSEHDVVQYDVDLGWSEVTPSEGFFAWVLDENLLYYFNGTSWVHYDTVIDHGTISGLGDDDHTQYVRVDGTRSMTAGLIIIEGSSPTERTPLEIQDDSETIFTIKYHDSEYGVAGTDVYLTNEQGSINQRIVLVDGSGTSSAGVQLRYSNDQFIANDTLFWDIKANGNVTNYGTIKIVNASSGADPVISSNSSTPLLDISGEIRPDDGSNRGILLRDNVNLSWGSSRDVQADFDGSDFRLSLLSHGADEDIILINFNDHANADISFNLYGHVTMKDRNDGSVSLFELDMKNRTLDIGASADPVAVAIDGDIGFYGATPVSQQTYAITNPPTASRSGDWSTMTTAQKLDLLVTALLDEETMGLFA